MKMRCDNFFLKQDEVKLWFSVFFALSFIFSPCLFNFIWGNHDWVPIIAQNKLNFGFIEGRFSQYVMINLLSQGMILPVFNFLFGFVIYALALVLLYTRFFEFGIKRHTVFFFISVASLPYICEILYFQFILISQLSWPFFVVLSLLCLKKSVMCLEENNVSYRLFASYWIMGFLLLLFALGGYPACVNLFVTAVALYIINQTLIHKKISELIKISMPFVFCLIISFLVLFFIYAQMQRANVMNTSMYNSQYPSFFELILKIFSTVWLSVRSLLQPQPFFSIYLKFIIFAIFVLFAILSFLRINALRNRIVFLFLIFISLLCIKFSAWLSSDKIDAYFLDNDPVAFMVRADFYAIPCLLLFCLEKVLEIKGKLVCNIVYLLSLMLIFMNVKADFNFEKVQFLGFHAEALLQERVNQRIQESVQYQPMSYYNVLQLGETSLRLKYYKEKFGEQYGFYTLKTPFTRYWLAGDYYNFYEPYDFVSGTNGIMSHEITSDMEDFILNKMKIWPDRNAVFVDGQRILVIISTEGQQLFKAQFYNLLRDL